VFVLYINNVKIKLKFKKGAKMCLLISMALFAAGYNFYTNEFITQAIMSWSLAMIILSFFTYRMIKNRRCIFGDKRDCNKERK